MIVVTGGAGFIGSVLAYELNQLFQTPIVIVDRLLESEKWKNLISLKYSQYLPAEEVVAGLHDDLLVQAKIIFHLGACSHTTEKNMDFLMVNNVKFSRKLFNLAAINNIPFIYASSAATYGGLENNFSDKHEMMGDLVPLNRYGYSKKLFDDYVLSAANKPSHFFGLKFFNVYGPNEYHKGEMRSMAHKSFHQLKTNGLVKLFKSHRPDYSDGAQLRDFIYVKDVVKVMIQLSDKKMANHSGIYNLGTGKARSFFDLVKCTNQSMGNKDSNFVEFIPMPDSLKNQYQYFTEAKMEKLKSILPEIKFQTLEEGIDDYVTNYLRMGDRHYGQKN